MSTGLSGCLRPRISGRKTRRIGRSLWLRASILAVLAWTPVLLSQSYPDKPVSGKPVRDKPAPDQPVADIAAPEKASLTPAADEAKSKKTLPVVTDWSHHHLIFSQPATEEQAKRIQRDPRYWQQQRRNVAAVQGPAAQGAGELWSPPAAEHRSNQEKSHHPQKPHKDWAEDMGAGATVGAGVYPAKYSLSLGTANCANAPQPDFAVYGTGLTSPSPPPYTQASIVAYDNLYSGCGAFGSVPSVYWAYDTGGTVQTSPEFSPDGTQVAFVQTNSASQGVLVLLKWAPSTTETVSSPVAPLSVLHGQYPTCTAPCMTTFLLRNSDRTPLADTTSSVYYDYGSDTAFVGSAAGWLHKFTPVFQGTPAVVKTGGWPVQVNLGSPGGTVPLSSPVFDSVSGNVFVGDLKGYLYRVDSSAAVTSSAQLDLGAGIVQGPVVDSTSQFVYVFVSSDNIGNGCANGTTCAGVYQLLTTFPAGDNGGGDVAVGNGTSGTLPMYIGAFDSTYLNSRNATGNLYVCGNTGGAPMLYQLPIQAGTVAHVNPGPTLASSTTPCSPVSSILNPSASPGPTEWLFASVQAGGNPTACASGGCLMNFINTPWKASTSYAVGQEIVDTNFYVEVVTSATGPSGTITPVWTPTSGKKTTDGGVQWINQGPATATPLPAWASGFPYIAGNEILDSNGDVELVTKHGTSGGAAPTWPPTPGLTITGDGTVNWVNVGTPATYALPAAGGTSGIVVDNTVGVGTLAGASQVYFSTLSDDTCATSGGAGGCAVQASQSGLQ